MSIQTKEKMVMWVKHNVEQSPSLEEVADYVGYSAFHCSREFKEFTGMTYKKYLANCKLEAIANDLVATSERIIDIAYRYGYSSSEVLSRAFRVVYLKSPREYREHYRSGQL